ncbi:peptidase M20, partial [Actinoplanes sp. NPDC051633]
MSRAEARVLEAIDEQALVGDLVEMIRVPSVTGSDAESDLQHRHARRLTQLGFEVDTWKLDLAGLAAHPDHPGTEAPRTEGYGVAGVLGPPGVPALVLQGHVDVVPPGDLGNWDDRDPWSGSIRGDEVHGRGACD